MFEKMATNPESDLTREHSSFSESERKFSRRRLLGMGGNVVAAVAILRTANTLIPETLPRGISLNRPPLALRPESVSRKAGDIEPFLVGNLEEEYGLVTITSNNELLFEPSGEFFSDEREFSYIHRANSIEYIHKAYEMGADLFDIDANNVSGDIYGEHGFIPEMLGLKIPVVVDPNELEFRVGKPEHTYEELVACVASLNTKERPVAVSTEIKREKEDFRLDTFHWMFAVHKEHDVPVRMHSTDPHQFDIFRANAT